MKTAEQIAAKCFDELSELDDKGDMIKVIERGLREYGGLVRDGAAGVCETPPWKTRTECAAAISQMELP